MHIWNGYNALNIAGNPMKDINANTYISEISIKSWKMIDAPHLTRILPKHFSSYLAWT